MNRQEYAGACLAPQARKSGKVDNHDPVSVKLEKVSF